MTVPVSPFSSMQMTSASASARLSKEYARSNGLMSASVLADVRVEAVLVQIVAKDGLGWRRCQLPE